MNNQDNKISVDNTKRGVITEIRALIDKSVKGDLKWYMKATNRHLIAHKTFGTLVIALSVSLPLIATTDYLDSQTQKWTISLIGILIAFISGLRSFHRWGEVYLANMRAMVELKNQVSSWELSMIDAENQPEAIEGARLAIKASKKLIAARDFIDQRNTEDYSQFFAALEKKDS